MDLFGISPLNLLLILAVMLIVFGPERLPEMAARAGKMVRDLRSYASDVTSEFSGEIAELQQHFDSVHGEIRSFGQDLATTSADIGTTVHDASAGLRQGQTASVPSLNEPPPVANADEKLVSLPSRAGRVRVDDYKPGS